MSGPRHPANRLFFPSHRTSMPRRQAMPSISAKSQFDVWGAPMSTVGRSGAGSVDSFQRLKNQKAREARRLSTSSL